MQMHEKRSIEYPSILQIFLVLECMFAPRCSKIWTPASNPVLIAVCRAVLPALSYASMTAYSPAQQAKNILSRASRRYNTAQ